MVNIVGVRFKPAGKIYYFDPVDIDIKLGQDVIVETARGLEYGMIVIEPKAVAKEDLVS
ncbi:MAG: stage 0 sporulation protein, partial [Peptostreptococcus sp.]|nr:stage 0 sporulation protein [Peptostreptococcus sp.]